MCKRLARVGSSEEILSYLAKESEFDATKQVKDDQETKRDADGTSPKI